AHCRYRVRLTGRDDQDAGHVISAVTVLWPVRSQLSVLECSPVVRHLKEVIELGNRRADHTSASCSASNPAANSTYAPATTGQPMLGARRAASAAIRAVRSSSVSNRRSADANPSGSS